MRVVFLDDVEGVARAGDIKNVAAGYARNYLLPRRLAAAATAATVQKAEAEARRLVREQEKLDETGRQLAAIIEGASITIRARVGEQGRLYGSVTAADIADELTKLAGTEVEVRQVLLGAPLKDLGAHEVTIALSRNVRPQVTIEVAALEEED